MTPTDSAEVLGRHVAWRRRVSVADSAVRVHHPVRARRRAGARRGDPGADLTTLRDKAASVAGYVDQHLAHSDELDGGLTAFASESGCDGVKVHLNSYKLCGKISL